MAKKVTKYMANDGTLFDKHATALEHENKITRSKLFNKVLKQCKLDGMLSGEELGNLIIANKDVIALVLNDSYTDPIIVELLK